MTPNQASLDLYSAGTDSSGNDFEYLPVPGAGLRFCSRFYAADKATHLFRQLESEVPWQQDALRIAGRLIPVPRLQAWYGDAESAYQYSGLNLTPLPWSPLLQAIREDIQEASHWRFNAVLVNYYRNGDDSVAWHADDEPELGPSPAIASLSLGVSRQFQLKPKSRKNSHPPLKCMLTHGSLLLMGPGLQEAWQHRVPKETGITAGRINLTFRYIQGAAL